MSKEVGARGRSDIFLDSAWVLNRLGQVGIVRGPENSLKPN